MAGLGTDYSMYMVIGLGSRRGDVRARKYGAGWTGMNVYAAQDYRRDLQGRTIHCIQPFIIHSLFDG